MNNKGFTLVELIAMLAVLAILMVITVPNMAGILKNSKDSITIEDVNKMLASARTKFKTKDAKYPKEENECVVLTLGFIDSNSDFNKGINDGTYSKTKSYVVVKKSKFDEYEEDGSKVEKYKYKFYMRLVEENKNKQRQYEMKTFDYDEFVKNPKNYINETTIKNEILPDEDITTKPRGEWINFVNDPTGDKGRNISDISCHEVLEIYS